MKIYVACLAAYNSGILHGAWIDASDEETMQEAIDAMLKKSPAPDAEEYAIHDYDDFPNLGEYPGLERVAWVADLIDNSDFDADVVAAVIDNWRNDLASAEKALNDNHGVWDSFQDYADDFADEMLACHDCGKGEWIKQYFNYEQYARTIEHDYTVIDVPKGVFIALNA